MHYFTIIYAYHQKVHKLVAHSVIERSKVNPIVGLRGRYQNNVTVYKSFFYFPT